MRRNIDKDIVPLLVSVILVLISVGIMLFGDNILNDKHYVGIGLVGISTILYFKNKKAFVYLFGFTLILGTINLIDIYYVNMLFRIGPIQFNTIFLILLIVFLMLNKGLLNGMFPEKEMQERNTETLHLIKNYEQKFQSKTESELKNIADEKSGYVNEAKIASKNILRDKYLL